MQYVLVGMILLGCGCGRVQHGGATSVASGASGGPSGGVAVAAGPSSSAALAAVESPAQLVIDGTLRLEVEETKALIPSLRAQLEQLGGRIVEEVVSGIDTDWQARLKLRVPPDQVESVVTWLAAHGDLLEKRISASDVSKTLFDQELAIKNAQVTLERLEVVLRQGGLSMQDVLAVEQEMTRLRGEIESIKGQAQFLKDRVALATLEVVMARKPGAIPLTRAMRAKAYPGARVSTLVLLTPDGRPQTRLGGGIVLHALFRAATLELELYRTADDGSGDRRSMAVIASYGGAAYSDFLGRGERRFGNPYLGLRTGYGYLDSHRFLLQAEAGLELFKSRLFVVDASARFTGLIGSKVDAAAIFGASAAVVF